MISAERGVQSTVLGSRDPYLDTAEVRGSGASAAPRLSFCVTGEGGWFRAPRGFLLGAGCMGLGFLGKSSPWVPTDLLGCRSLSAVAVWVRVGILELLAAPTEILLLTANACRGCFYGNTGQ